MAREPSCELVGEKMQLGERTVEDAIFIESDSQDLTRECDKHTPIIIIYCGIIGSSNAQDIDRESGFQERALQIIIAIAVSFKPDNKSYRKRKLTQLAAGSAETLTP